MMGNPKPEIPDPKSQMAGEEGSGNGGELVEQTSAEPATWNVQLATNSLGLMLVGLLFILGAPILLAAEDEKIPPLQPPRGPLPPDFWEQYGLWVVVGGVAVVMVISFVLWLWLRPKPPAEIPPEAKARALLSPLHDQPETGSVLSRVSYAVRFYFGAAFGLAEGELTTTEFCHALNASPELGPDLKGQVCAFLRECDQRKFAPEQAMTPMGAVTQALKFVDEGEARVAELKAAREQQRAKS